MLEAPAPKTASGNFGLVPKIPGLFLGPSQGHTDWHSQGRDNQRSNLPLVQSLDPDPMDLFCLPKAY